MRDFSTFMNVLLVFGKLKRLKIIFAPIFITSVGSMPNNFVRTIPNTQQLLRAVAAFKDEYLLDYINIEHIDEQDDEQDERVLEQSIVQNIKKFIMTFGNDFSFIGNQYRIEVDGEESFIDLLFFNRELNALVAAVRDFLKPMGVATYKTSAELPEKLRKALPDMDELKKLL